MLPFLSLSLFFFLSLLFFHFHGTSASKGVSVEYMYPPISATSLLYVDSGGMFLTSKKGDFQAVIYKPGTQESRYYLSVFHAPTKTQIWTANRNRPIPDQSSMVKLTANGLSVEFSNGTVLWSTPPLKAPVSALCLLDTGNLVLLDVANNSLWESFNFPSDTLVSGQLLPAGSYLSSSVSSESDLSQGDYRLDVTAVDALLNWSNATYWRLSNDKNSVKDWDAPVAYMTTNDSGLYLLESKGTVVFQIALPTAQFRIVQLLSDGRFHIISYQTISSSTSMEHVFMAPTSSCDLPLACGSLGLCSLHLNSSSCTCPPQFISQYGGCTPGSDVSLATNTSCGSSTFSYMFVGSGVTYFANKYRSPIASGRNISNCRDLCSSNCSCLGYFFDISSQSCFFLQHPLGSLINANTSESSNAMAYVKTQGSYSQHKSTPENNVVPIVVPSVVASFLVIVLGLACFTWRYKREKRRMKEMRLAIANDKLHAAPLEQISDSDYLFSESGDDLEEILIPGLPTRFTLQQLEDITSNFLTKIGSGGFGSVYKGELSDKSQVAVKKIEAAGLHGRKEFCTEIAVIGNIHHVNLVHLSGYCAQGSHRLLVFEYMNRGSLDRSLFRPTGETLDWDERMNIAIGAARGLAYLHSGCQPKILHCDIKPENILLDDEGQVKIADFGMAKLLTPEQSGLFTTMRGTRGYLAPEWLANTAISDRTDVYSFGMVLLELVRGMKNRSEHMNDCESKWSVTTSRSSHKGYEYFPLVALHMHEKRNYKDLADPRLEGRFVASEVETLVKTALCCLHEEPAMRPSMTSVVAMLEGTMEVREPRIESLGFLRLYGRGVLGASSSGGTFDIEEEFMMNKVIGASHMTTNTTSGWSSFMSMPQLSGPR
ncbi:hypothetical protein LUZ63_008279 [Rhynchospora breviuscula]|uniref:Receptor-like serine/threonine-protein kinase n=1 Tax=Rhynchospora breviuscula TaxID=2022672 RepID=A0A9Q0CTB3_9POAL|nr:hypothetical protein LUZ63_008279 [Rhynchospora breviuscula]